MSTDYVGIRMPPDMRAAAESLASTMNMSISEWIRHLIFAAIEGQVPDVTEGYVQARSLATRLAFDALRRALSELPETFEDAMAMATEPGPGRPPGESDDEAPTY